MKMGLIFEIFAHPSWLQSLCDGRPSYALYWYPSVCDKSWISIPSVRDKSTTLCCLEFPVRLGYRYFGHPTLKFSFPVRWDLLWPDNYVIHSPGYGFPTSYIAKITCPRVWKQWCFRSAEHRFRNRQHGSLIKTHRIASVTTHLSRANNCSLLLSEKRNSDFTMDNHKKMKFKYGFGWPG